jgi:hypothetical protein
MQISNVASGLTDPTGLAQRTTSTAAATVAQAGAAAAPTAASTTALQEVLAKYDVTDISPNDYSAMIQDLYQKGAISKTDFQNLTAVRADLDAAGMPPDQSMNVLDFCQQQVANAQKAGGGTAANAPKTGLLLQRLGWMQKFAAGHAQPESIGMDTVV